MTLEEAPENKWIITGNSIWMRRGGKFYKLINFVQFNEIESGEGGRTMITPRVKIYWEQCAVSNPKYFDCRCMYMAPFENILTDAMEHIA